MHTTSSDPELESAAPRRYSLQTLETDVVRKHTDAPLRLRGTFEFHAPAATVFARTTDPELIATWFALIKGGGVDHATSCNLDGWGAGSKRRCQTRGMGTIDETILYYDAPYACVYTAKNPMMPVRNHAALISVVPTAAGCRFTWHQYFDDRGLLMRLVFPRMMASMMSTGMAKLVGELGGTAGAMEVL